MANLTKSELAQYLIDKKKVTRDSYFLLLLFLITAHVTVSVKLGEANNVYSLVMLAALPLLANFFMSMLKQWNFTNTGFVRFYQHTGVLFLTAAYVAALVWAILTVRHRPVTNEDPSIVLWLLFGTPIGAFALTTFLAIVFKVVHHHAYLTKTYFYDFDNSDLKRWNEDASPEKKKKRQKEKESMIYSTMGEIELQVALKSAIEEEDYETAEVIRKELERFR